jgi:membrane associated rhomboid family serine protease
MSAAMLSDRNYARNDYPRRERGALTWLLSAVAAGFILVAAFERLFNSAAFTEWLQLTLSSLQRGHVWQLVSYSFIHPVADIPSVFVVGFNLMCLYLLGREMESLLGTRHFLWLYFSAILMGAGAWLAVNYRFGGVLMGTWPGIAACLTLFSCLNPEQEIRMLFLFVPITIKPRYLVWFIAAVEVAGLVGWEIRGEISPFGYAHSAHLGGMLAGYLYFKLVHQLEWRNPDGRTEIELPAWLRKSRKPNPAAPGKFKLNLTSREDLRAEVDRILDKINSQGFNALTAEEKQLLDEARDQLSRS